MHTNPKGNEMWWAFTKWAYPPNQHPDQEADHHQGPEKAPLTSPGHWHPDCCCIPLSVYAVHLLTLLLIDTWVVSSLALTGAVLVLTLYFLNTMQMFWYLHICTLASICMPFYYWFVMIFVCYINESLVKYLLCKHRLSFHGLPYTPLLVSVEEQKFLILT